MVQIADFVIIGGGMAGVSLGAELSKDASVIILETEKSIGYHSTGRSAAIYIKNYGNETLRALNAVSEPFFLEPENVSDSSLLTPRGELMFARDFELDTLNQYLEGSTGMDVISAKEAGELVPALKTDTIVKAVYEATAQDIDVDRMLQGYLKLFRHNGGTVVTDAEVKAAKRVGDCWQLQTAAGEIQGQVVINAAGAWADKVASIFGAKPKGITPMRRSAALLPKPDYEGFDKWPLFVSASETFYAKPEAGLLMVSPADEDPVEPHDAWPDDMVLAEGLHRFEEAVNIPVQRVEHSWAGLRSFAPDRTPVAGFANDLDGFFWLAGQGGYGIQTAPALSQLSAGLCLGREVQVSEAVLAALDPNRF
ncbi:FAD-dependent oxidoreductase [Sneathiella sp. P13V-1]|uniref:NAD(P)/FAD-dependent oxidoreductase n=1 Tax=Sneathiella sp. P13V-1 TaxID=2697366 RepID=UPI00187BB70A|nr:FAD-binding oxidoreductase [Sneathiella sp. P13V-1]MBE7637736.1 FAD-dependent oxidoreductase [Sneathiella sp. P13V-1]